MKRHFQAQLLIRPIFAQLAASRPRFAHRRARVRPQRTSLRLHPRHLVLVPGPPLGAHHRLRAFLHLRPSEKSHHRPPLTAPAPLPRRSSPNRPRVSAHFPRTLPTRTPRARRDSRPRTRARARSSLVVHTRPRRTLAFARRTVTRPHDDSIVPRECARLSTNPPDGAEDPARRAVGRTVGRSVGRSVGRCRRRGPVMGHDSTVCPPPRDESRVQSRDFDSLAETSSGSTIDRSRPVDGHRPRAKISSVDRSIDRIDRFDRWYRASSIDSIDRFDSIRFDSIRFEAARGWMDG